MKRLAKKLSSAIVIASMLFTAVPTLADDGTKQNDGYLLYEDFDSYESVGDLEKNWDKVAGNVLGDDDDGGKAIGLHLQPDIDNYITKKYFNETVKDGVVSYRYSFKPGEKISTLVWAVDSNGKYHIITFFNPDGSLVVGHSSVTYPANIVAKGLSHNTWYDVEAMIDLDNHTIQADVTDRATGEVYSSPTFALTANGNSDLADVARIHLQVWSKQDSTSYFDNIAVERVPLAIAPETKYVSNIFPNGEKPVIDVSLKNATNESVSGMLEWVVENEEKGTVSTDSREISFSADEAKEIKIEPPIDEYGLYKLHLTAKYKREGSDREYEYKRTLKFSYVYSCDDGEYSDILGFSTHHTRTDEKYMDEYIRIYKMTGSASWRDAEQWDNVEKTKGNFTFQNKTWMAWDAFKGTANNNIHSIHFGNKLYIEQVDSNGNPIAANVRIAPKNQKEFEAYGKYASEIAKIGVQTGAFDWIEFWNEFDGSFNTNHEGADVGVAMQKEMYEQSKAVAPSIKVIGIGGSGYALKGNYNYLQDWFKLGGLKYSDAVSLHPYDRGQHFPSSEWLGYILDFKTDMQKFSDEGYGDVCPIIFTEIGWSTATESPNQSHHPTWSEKIQAKNPLKLIYMCKAYDLAEIVNYYDFKEDGDNIADEESCFGIVADNTNSEGPLLAKPAYASICALNKLTYGGTEFVGKAEYDEEFMKAAYCLKRTRDGKNIAIAWSDNENDTFSLNLGCENVNVYDMYGNKIEVLHSNDGVFDIGVSNDLAFIEGNFQSFEKADGVITQEKSVLTATRNDILTLEISDKNLKNYTIKTDYNGDNFTYLGGETLEECNGKLQFKTSPTANGEYPINVMLYDGDECKYISHNLVKIKDPISVAVNSRQYSETNSNHWELEVAVTNNSNVSNVTGYSELTSPVDFAEYAKVIEFKELEPTKTKKMYFQLPEMLRKRTQTILGDVTLDYGEVVQFEQGLDFTSMWKTENPPKIDGVADDNEWSASCVAADKEENINYVTGTRIKTWTGKDDLSLSAAKFMWDDDYFYLLAVVKDDIHVKTTDAVNLWRYDSLQFGIEDEYRNVPNRAQYPFTEIGISETSTGPVVYRYSGAKGKAEQELTEVCEVAVGRENGVTTYEAKIPWDELFEEGYEVDQSYIYGFSMLINDNDTTGRWGWTQYNGGIGLNKSAREFGQMRVYE